MRRKMGLVAVVAALLAISAPYSFARTPGKEAPLYAGVAPGSEGDTQVEARQRIFDQTVIVNVTRPTITPVLPDKAKATGAAIVIAPGGGFKFLSIDSEGFMVARWLADRGIAAFVLKYRLDATPSEPDAFKKNVMALFAAAGASGPLPDHAQAVADTQTAVKVVRQHAAEWGLDPHRVGLIGFSAGADAALKAILADEPASLPDFAGLIYGPMGGVAVPKDAPPVFVAFAANDPIFGGKGYGLIDSWMTAKRPVELHVYEKGGHGFGMRPQGASSDHWIEEFYWWLDARGLLNAGHRLNAMKAN
ncbi:MAG TPA: alpha/beta hydrolase [Alphaproteobacteria bacterium]|nr:alpha/beta hydrolase [Alphaproteobacteria bacterium]